MSSPIPNIDPVAIALDEVAVGPQLKFSGIDLETGLRISVSVDRPGARIEGTDVLRFQGRGLLLLLSVESIDATN